MRDKIVGAASLLLVAACGGSSSGYTLTGTGSVSGTIGGQPMAVLDAVSNVLAQGSNGSAAAILLTTQATQCSLYNAHQAVKNGQLLVLQFGIASGNSIAPPTIGTYDLLNSTGNVAVAQYLAAGANCVGNLLQAVSGTITVTSVAATGYGGSFNLLFGNEHVTGAFNSGTCSSLGTTSLTCPP